MALLDELRERSYTNSFVYTKPKNIVFFKSLGYRVVAETENLAFLEQGIPSFSDYLKLLKEHFVEGTSNSAIVMNANPFTLGHQYLVETAARQSSHLYVFVVSEDRSFFNTNDRMEMVKRGVSHLPNVTVLPTRDYMVSSATFPSYFLKEKADLEVAKVQATLDATLFLENIVPTLQLTKRYVGQEPLSPVTSVYNDARLRASDYRQTFCRGRSGECDAGARCHSRQKRRRVETARSSNYVSLFRRKTFHWLKSKRKGGNNNGN